MRTVLYLTAAVAIRTPGLRNTITWDSPAWNQTVQQAHANRRRKFRASPEAFLANLT